jgi:pimeloyl-ACP methyl ester carboxylesterase
MNTLSASKLGGLLFCFIFLSVGTSAQEPAPQVPEGKTPIIIIPGMTGSELVNSKTGEEAWFRTGRAKDDDIRLPISPNLARNRDDLIPRDIIRSVKFLKFLPETEIYERLVDALEKRGGYKEGNWNAPAKDGHQDTFYVYPYDWRRDNVESARLLIRRVESLKRRLGKPQLKFNIVAHSMGGLIARYAAMYGNAELPSRTPRPTWSGARHFNKIFLLGTPNEGSVSTVNVLLEGFSYIGGGINLPFIQDINRFDVFTIPSIYQLLPHEGSSFAYDENLKPIKMDIYDPATWDKYGWSIWLDKDFTKKFTPLEQKNARPYFTAVLNRAKKFQAALNADSRVKVPISFYLMGADCKETPSGMLILRDEKKGVWEARFKPDSFVRSTGEKIPAEQIKELMVTMGDSVVTKRSLIGETLVSIGKKIFPVTTELFQCEGHSKLVTNPEIQDKLFLLLNPAAAN